MSEQRSVGWLRWVARGLGTLAAAWWVLAGVGHGLAGDEPWTAESTVLVVLVAVNVLGVILAWWRERLGWIVLVVGGAAMCVFAWVSAGRNRVLAVLVSGAPFLVSGILLWCHFNSPGRSGS